MFFMLFTYCSLLLVITSCGKKLPPVAPESVAPEPVKALRAISRDGRLLIVFDKPAKNVDGSKLTDLAGIKIMRRVAEESCRTCPEKFPVTYDIDITYPVGAVIEGDLVAYTDSSVEAGMKYEYKVVAYNRDGYDGPESQKASFLWALPAGKPGNLKGDGGDKAVDIEWAPPETLIDGSMVTDILGYNIYRREEGKGYPHDPVNPAPVTEMKFSNFGLKNDRVYYYTVRAARASNEAIVEGLSADEIAVTPREAEMDELKGDSR